MGSRLEKNSNAVRKRIESHNFQDEQGEEYEASKFGGFSDYMRRKKIKLQNLDAEIRSQSTENPPIFRNIVVHVNGYTQPSLRDLHNLVVSHGGGFLQYLDGKTAVTHVVAAHLTPKKKVEFARYRIVKPAWVVDSVQAGKLLPWDAYRVVDEGITQKVLGFENGQMVSQASTQRLGYRDQTETSWYTSQVRQSAQGLQHDGIGQYSGLSEIPLEGGKESGSVPVTHPPDLAQLLQRPPATTTTEGQAHDPADELESLDLDEMDSDAELMRIAEISAGPTETTGQLKENAIKSIGIPLSPIKESPNASEKRPLTAEEHNAILLSNPHMAKSSTANPDFINQYYRESRLHHLSTWKAELKAQLQARAQEKSSLQRARQKRAAGARRYIMHVDFDSFFAAVSLRQHPDLKDKPVVIAHGSGPGSEIASCNYPARKYGVKNGMWMKSALAMCPDLKVLPYDFGLYEEASKYFYDAILVIDGIVQSISIDEALVDISEQCIKAGGSDGRAVTEGSLYREQEKAMQIAQDLRASIKEKTGCDVSVGIGNNILLAKVALRKAKPAGQYLIKPGEVLEFLGELVATDLPGIAWSIGKKLEEIGVKFVKDIRTLTKERLVNTLGPKTGEKVWDYARGIDRQEVGDQVIRKSVSAEINWGIRFLNQQQAEDFVQCLCDELSKRLLEQLVKGKQLTMKIMHRAADAGMDPPKNLGHGKCDTFNKSIVLGVATHDKAVIGKEAISILRSYGFSPGELRGLGVQMQKLEPLKPVNASASTLFDSSQRRLQFKKPAVPMMHPDTSDAPAPDSATSPATSRTPSKLTDSTDPIEEIPTPKKAKGQALVMGAVDVAEKDHANQRPLNISGTQFILPTQVDTSVLAELPPDIRSKLAAKQKSIVASIVQPASSHLEDSDFHFPSQSQLDPGILDELPEDVKQELLSHYRNSGKEASSSRSFQILPQSPGKARPVVTSKKSAPTPTKKAKTSSLLTKGRSRRNVNSSSTLTQSNFVSMPKVDGVQAAKPTEKLEEISQSFLDELPADIRHEVLAEQKRNRLKAKSGLDLGTGRKKFKNYTSGHDSDTVGGQQKLQLPAKPAIPTFTSRRLSSLPELRDAMTAWVEEFSADGEEGPFPEDVNALAQYLSRVVLEERDMAKAVAVVNWVETSVRNEDIHAEPLVAVWEKALTTLKEGVQTAMLKRGLPPVEFG